MVSGKRGGRVMEPTSAGSVKRCMLRKSLMDRMDGDIPPCNASTVDPISAAIGRASKVVITALHTWLASSSADGYFVLHSS